MKSLKLYLGEIMENKDLLIVFAGVIVYLTLVVWLTMQIVNVTKEYGPIIHFPYTGDTYDGFIHTTKRQVMIINQIEYFKNLDLKGKK